MECFIAQAEAVNYTLSITYIFIMDIENNEDIQKKVYRASSKDLAETE